jgi:murein DD-endopeptidase MepM/ murein hydrolase activator NlpD
MAFVIVSAGHLTDSRLRTLRARPVLVAAAAGMLLLMSACLTLGFHLARVMMPVAAVPHETLDEPRLQAITTRLGALAGRLARVEQETATLARHLGTTPLTAALDAGSRPDSSGGPMIPAGDIASLETGIARLEDALAQLSSSAIDRELEAMAFPSRMPVAGSRIPVSSQFGKRHDPFTGRLARHTGLDIPAQHGTPILASGGGRVVFSGRRGAYGQAVVIDHGDGLATLYGHASRLLVKTGDVVLPQQKIALVGSTGRSTGPHLHFEVIRKGHRVEPREYLAHVLGQGPGTTAQ